MYVTVRRKKYSHPTFETLYLKVFNDKDQVIFEDHEQSSGYGYVKMAKLEGMIKAFELMGIATATNTEIVDGNN